MRTRLGQSVPRLLSTDFFTVCILPFPTLMSARALEHYIFFSIPMYTITLDKNIDLHTHIYLILYLYFITNLAIGPSLFPHELSQPSCVTLGRSSGNCGLFSFQPLLANLFGGISLSSSFFFPMSSLMKHVFSSSGWCLRQCSRVLAGPETTPLNLGLRVSLFQALGLFFAVFNES
jgi:hypothetical protein